MNSLVRSPQGQLIAPGTQDGQWMWDGQNWICVGCDGSNVPPFPCPPPGFPPAGCPPWFSGMNSPPWYPGANAGVSFGLTAPANAVRGHFWWNGKVLAIFDGAVWVNTATGVIVPPDGNGGGGTNGGGGGTGTVVISTTPPGNPVPGMQWWNGSVLQMWDGLQWKLIGPGAAAGPVPTTTKVFSVSNTPGYVTTAANAWDILPIVGSPTVDTLTGWNATTKQFRPTKAGVYQFSATVWNGGTFTVMQLVRNDQGNIVAQASDIVAVGESASPGEYVNINNLAVMNGTTDFVRLWVYAAAASNNVWVGATPPALMAWLMP